MNKHNYFLSFILCLFTLSNLSSQNYCTSKGNTPWQEWIANVQFSTINNTSSKEGYGNFISQTTTVAKGTSYPLSILQGFSWAADPTNTTQQGKVWIDYNQNGTFEASELVASFTRTTVTANITIPTTALTGATRMRVSLKTTGAPTACEVFDKGEVEDYSVSITGGTVSGTPNLVVTNVTGPTAARPSENITLNVTVTNTGTAPTVASKLVFRQNNAGFGINIPLTKDSALVSVLAPGETRIVGYPLVLNSPIYQANTKFLGFTQTNTSFDYADYYVYGLPSNESAEQTSFSLFSKFKFNIPITYPQGNISASVVPNKTRLATDERWNATYTVKNNGTATAKQVFVNFGTFANFGRNQNPGTFQVDSATNVPGNTFVRSTFFETNDWGWEIFDLGAGESRNVTLNFSKIISAGFLGEAVSTLRAPTINTFSNIVNTNTTVNPNISITFNTTFNNLPDLTIDGFINANTVSGQNLVDGQLFVKNIGGSTAFAPFPVTLTLRNSNGRSYFSNAVQIANNLAAGDSVAVSITDFLVPNNAPADNYQYLFEVGNFNVRETTLANNIKSIAGNVRNPNLTAFLSAFPSILPDQTVNRGSLFTLIQGLSSFSTGTPRKDSFTVRAYLSKDTLFSADDYVIRDFKEYFRYEASSSGFSPFNTALVPATFATGVYYIVYEMDYDVKIFESNETDNKNFIRINWVNGAVANSPDLTLTNLTIPTPSVQQGNILNFAFDLKNIGNANVVGNFNIKSYLSTDQTLSADDYQDGIVPTANLAAGITTPQVAGAMTVRNTVAAGQYYLILKVDGDNQISESNETNNIVVSTNTITVSTPSNNTNCRNNYGLLNFDPINCQSSGGPPPTPAVGMFVEFLGANLTDGFYLSTNNSTRPTNKSNLWSKTVVAAQPALFNNCSGNWTYFKAYGFSTIGEQVFENLDKVHENVIVRIKGIGTTNPLDQIIVEVSNSEGVFNFGSYQSSAVRTKCNTCSITDQVPPVITGCPTAPVIFPLRDTKSYSAKEVSFSANIAISDNCSDNFSTFRTGNSFRNNNDGASFPLTLVAFDSAGNRATCNFTVKTSTQNATTFCASKGTAPWEYWVGNISLGTINNTSDKFKDFSTLGYSDYTNISTTLNKGTSYPLSISPGLSWIGNVPNAYARVWIDFNQNKTFEANELVLEKTNQNPLTQSVLIPTTALTGNTRMRVALKFGAYPTACETFDRGEVEDYTVNIQDGTVTNCDLVNVGTLPQNVTLTTTGTCQPYKWTPPYILAPCSRGDDKYVSWVAIRSNPQVQVLKIINQPLTQTFQDSACFPIGTTTVVYQTAFGLDSFKVTVTGGTTGGGADLALSIVSTPSVYRKFTVNTMRIMAQNVGNQTLTNVKIELKRPAQTSNGGSKVPSVGSFQDFCPGGIECSEWTIPTLAAGATATLDAPFFILDATGGIVVTTKLLGSTPTDANTTNNTATITISPAAAGASVLALSRQKPTQYISIVVQSIEPTLTDGNVTVRLESIVEKEVSFEIYNTVGKQVKRENRKVEKGENLLNFDVSELPQGMYLISPANSNARNTPSKFIKF